MTETNKKKPISVVVITLNEENNIKRCLESVQWADEIVVVDSGSSDETCNIAKSLGARVIHNDWPGFGEQKRFATAAAKYDWVLSLDADEWLSHAAKTSIQTLFSSTPALGVYKIRRRHYFMGKLLRYGISYPDDITRIYNRQKANWNKRAVHESIETDLTTGFLSGDILHESSPSLSFYIAKLNQYTSIQAKDLARQEKKASMIHLTFHPMWQFVRGYILKLGFLDGIPGLVHNIIAAFNTFLRYAKVREAQCSKQ
ncbi:MAG: glycosyltransferase family 2 protein [Mariprofundaceae bacterium]